MDATITAGFGASQAGRLSDIKMMLEVKNMNLINNNQRRPPRPPTPAQIFQAKIDYLEHTLEQVVKDTNAHIAAIEARANEEIKLSQQAQVDHDAKILAAWEENTRILLAENESLRAEVKQLKAENKKLRRKTKQPRKEIEEFGS